MSDRGMKWDRFAPEAKRLRLFGYWRSSASWRVRWALNLKKLTYEYVPVNLLKNENRLPSHLQRHPLGMVPVLEINDEIYLTESVAMIEWLEEVYSLQGPSLFPGTPLERAWVRSLAEVINADTAPLQSPRTQKRHSDEPAARTAWARDFIRDGLSAYEKLSRGTRGKFSVGDQVTAADLHLIPQIYNARRMELDVDAEFPALAAIYGNCLATEACLAASPEKQSDAAVTT
jgi:maleylacetoacetate isomerase